MKEYLEMGHMEAETAADLQLSNTFYILYHYVVKEESTTSKSRVVFESLSKTRTGKSLNDCLMVCGTIQDPLLHILLTLRTYPVASTANFAEMYRQIKVRKSDCDY